MKLTDVQRQMMRHALGLDDSKAGNAYRNRYVCGSTAAWDCWIALMERGFAVPGRPATYHVTRAGFAEVALPGETFDADTFDVVDAIERGRSGGQGPDRAQEQGGIRD